MTDYVFIKTVFMTQFYCAKQSHCLSFLGDLKQPKRILSVRPGHIDYCNFGHLFALGLIKVSFPRRTGKGWTQCDQIGRFSKVLGQQILLQK